MLESEECFKTFFNQSFQFALVLDAKGTAIEMNELCRVVCGPFAENVIGKPLWEAGWWRQFPEEQEKTKIAIKKTLEGNSFSDEVCFIDKDKQIRQGIRICSPIKDETGKVKRISVVSLDITERKKAEEKLDKETDLTRILLDKMPCIALILKKGTREIIACNEVATQYGAVVGKTCFNTCGQSNIPCNWCLAPETWASDEERHLEVEALGHFWDAHWIPITEDLYMHYVFDITKRKRNEEQLRKLSHAIEHSPVTIMITDAAGDIEYINPKFTELTGYSADEVLGKNLNILNSKKKPSEFYNQLWNTIQCGGTWHGEFHNQKKDGELYWENASISPVIDDKGSITHFVAVKEDITGRKHVEEELTKHREHLQDLVEERTAELTDTYQQLLHAEKLSATGKLSASIAHEFNNPIFGIRNVLEGIKSRFPLKKLDKEEVDLAISECNRIKNLISSLQNFHKPTSGKVAYLDIHKALDDMLLLCKKQFNVKKIMVQKQYAAHIPKIKAVEDQIKQVILNLLTNAEEAIPKKGGTIKVKTKATDHMVAIQIQDTGLGIKAKYKDKIFEPFFSTKPAVKGAGLGLSVSYGIIKTHGGNIKFENQPGKGTTFTVTLPIIKDI